MNHLRCKTCNKVSSPDIATEKGDYSKIHFVTDPVDPLSFICGDCEQDLYDQRDYYFFKDDLFGWEEDGLFDVLDIEEEILISQSTQPADPPNPPRLKSK